MRVLGIESSCDETAAAIVQDGRRLLASTVSSSMDKHAVYGGVVPEIAARSHIEVILPVIKQTLQQADCSWDDIDAIAVTQGAGLGGSLLIGVLTARTLAITKRKPLYGVNHVAGHLFANFITESALPGLALPAEQPTYPMLGIIVSGGHSQLVLFRSAFDYDLLGQTHDDAIGEAFDKVGRILGLPYPGGPNVSRLAASGDRSAYKLPKAKLARPYDFSYSGLKTAVLRAAQQAIGADHTLPSYELPDRLDATAKRDLAASFEHTAVETLVDKAVAACQEFAPASVVVGGGVAANGELRRQLSARLPLPVRYPDMQLCTDNAAMIATLACHMIEAGQPAADAYAMQPLPGLSM